MILNVFFIQALSLLPWTLELSFSCNLLLLFSLEIGMSLASFAFVIFGLRSERIGLAIGCAFALSMGSYVISSSWFVFSF